MTREQQAQVEAHAYLVRQTARRFPTQAYRWDDLLGDGYLGLCRAVVTFDPARRVQFRTHAILCIRGAMLQGARDWDYLTRDQRALVRACERRGEAAPAVYQSPAPLVWWDADEDDPDRTAADSLTAPHDTAGEAAAALQYAQVRAAVDRLPERERYVVLRYHLDGRTMREIAGELGRHESRAWQLYRRGRARLREWLA